MGNMEKQLKTTIINGLYRVEGLGSRESLF